jgi:hypothetical protein
VAAEGHHQVVAAVGQAEGRLQAAVAAGQAAGVHLASQLAQPWPPMILARGRAPSLQVMLVGASVPVPAPLRQLRLTCRLLRPS